MRMVEVVQESLNFWTVKVNDLVYLENVPTDEVADVVKAALMQPLHRLHSKKRRPTERGK